MSANNLITEILNKKGLTISYVFDETEEIKQTGLKTGLAIEKAFQMALDSILIKNKGSFDGFYTMITNSSENFNLPSAPSDSAVADAIKNQLNADHQAFIKLVPLVIDSDASGNAKVFPPEDGETADEYWIWYISSPAFFPGPHWMMVKADGSEAAYSYGVL